MRLRNHAYLILVLPLFMAAIAAAQTVSSAAPTTTPSDEAEAQVDRVIKAVMEVRLDEAAALDLAPKKTSNAGFYFGGQLVGLTDDAPLEERLVGQVPTFTDGPRVDSDVRVEEYRLGYRYPIRLGPQTAARFPVSLHSLVGVTALDLKYQMEDAEGLSIEQGLLKAAPLTGFEMEWPLSREFSVAGEMSSTVPLSSMPWIFNAQILGRYQLAGQRNGAGVRAFGGVGYERIMLRDQGEVISDINSDSGAMLMIGIEARF